MFYTRGAEERTIFSAKLLAQIKRPVWRWSNSSLKVDGGWLAQ
jgi:hypothetical protein